MMTSTDHSSTGRNEGHLIQANDDHPGNTDVAAAVAEGSTNSDNHRHSSHGRSTNDRHRTVENRRHPGGHSRSSKRRRSSDRERHDDYLKDRNGRRHPEEDRRNHHEDSYYNHDNDRRRMDQYSYCNNNDGRQYYGNFENRRSNHSGRRPFHDRRREGLDDSRRNQDDYERYSDHQQDTEERGRDEPTEKYSVPVQPQDENLPANVQTDPRGHDPSKRITQKASSRGNGRNTESFDPASTLVRPDVRVLVGSASKETYDKPIRHDDVVIVPELFGREDNWDTYYQLIREMTELQEKQVKESEWISWHEGAHLIVKNPHDSPTFHKIIEKLCTYFNIDAKSAGTRFNWYKDSADWKAFHHDSAAFNPKRAKNQNITVGVSFGATRELAFLKAKDERKPSSQSEEPVRMYFPQTNNGVFTFGRDVNIRWKHGVNALPPELHDGKGRISIILWGFARNVIEEEGSPPLLGSDGQGPHANHNNHHKNHHHNKKRRSNHNHYNRNPKRNNSHGQ